MSANEVAFVGRFQPFHLGHWEIVAQLLQRAQCLYIGITNPDARSLSQKTSSPHRHVQTANPFSFHERMSMISATLDASQDHHCQTRIVPFPLDEPTLWHNYIPASATQVVRVFSDWEAEKIALLETGGYTVETLIGTASEKIAASDIRAAIAEDRPYSHWLPTSVAQVLKTIGSASVRSRISGVKP